MAPLRWGKLESDQSHKLNSNATNNNNTHKRRINHGRYIGISIGRTATNDVELPRWKIYDAPEKLPPEQLDVV